MNLNQAAKALLAGAATLFLWGAAQGCGPKAESYCNKKCDCVACDDATRALCVSTIEDAQKQAQEGSCESEYNDYFSCLDSETQCIDGRIDDDGCEVALEAVAKCGVFLGNACDKYLADFEAKLSECGIENPEGSGSIDCSTTAAKQAACLDACLAILDCECLLDAGAAGCSDKLQQYQSCTIPCVE